MTERNFVWPLRARLVLLCLLLASAAARAEQSLEFGDWVLHYVALPTIELPPATARSYGITRSARRGVLVLNLQHRDAPLVGVAAQVEGSVRNLIGQVKTDRFRIVREGQAVYSIAEFSFSNLETLIFDLQVGPPDQTARGRLRFQQQFWVTAAD